MNKHTSRDFFFFLIPFFCANSSHLVWGLGSGGDFSLGIGIAPAGNSARGSNGLDHQKEEGNLSIIPIVYSAALIGN